MGNSVKDNGRIYTPGEIVNILLDYAGYVSCPFIWKKHVIDNSCGDGQILCGVVRRYIASFSNPSDWELRDQLKEYIHGIELDETECEKCKENLNRILDEYYIERIDWDIRCGNSLTFRDEFSGKMDYVFGNPPYVRTKNIKKSDDDYKTLRYYSFSSKGMSDLYLAFYELGLEMRNDGGILCYIAPSSWTNSTSGEVMRNYIRSTRDLAAVIDFEHQQVFDNATTYVMITLFDNKPHKYIRYDKYAGYVETSDLLDYDDVFIDGKMYFANKPDLDKIKAINRYKKKTVEVKNGYATLADDIFIDELPEFKNYTIDVVKASTGKWKKCFFPYDKNLKLIDLSEIEKNEPDLYDYIAWRKNTLEARTYDKKGKDDDSWYVIGRSQGLNDTFVHKVSVNSLVKTPQDLKVVDVPAGKGVYGGLYVKTDKSADEIRDILSTWDFITYVRSLRKYKSGGYYTFSSKELERYLNYKINQ